VQAVRTAIAAGEKPGIAAVLAALTDISVVEARSFADHGVIVPVTGSRSLTVREIREEVEEVRDKFFYNAATLAAQLEKTRAIEGRLDAGVFWTFEPPGDGSGNPLGEHIAWGDTPLVPLPASGVAIYNFVGGTSPTDNFGRTGKLSAGRLGMDFQARQIKALDPISIAFGRLSADVPATGYQIAAGNTWNMSNGPQALSNVQCTGCNGTPQAIVNGRLVGVALRGYAAAIAVQGSVGSHPTPHVAGAVAAFGRQ
jgi:hypothetical protein